MNFKNDKFIKTVGLCAAGLALAWAMPMVATIAMGAAASYLYSKAPRNKANFFALGGAVVLGAMAGPSIIGLLALGGYGILANKLIREKDQRYYGKPYDQELIENVQKTVSKTFSSRK